MTNGRCRRPFSSPESEKDRLRGKTISLLVDIDEYGHFILPHEYAHSDGSFHTVRIESEVYDDDRGKHPSLFVLQWMLMPSWMARLQVKEHWQ